MAFATQNNKTGNYCTPCFALESFAFPAIELNNKSAQWRVCAQLTAVSQSTINPVNGGSSHLGHA
jgi:hypothetical protein